MPRNSHRRSRRGLGTTGADMAVMHRALNTNRPAMLTRVCNEHSQIATSAGGVINTINTLAPSSFSDWSSLAALYDEWRLLGVKIRIQSLLTYSTGVAHGDVICVFDNDDNSTALTSYGNGLDYTNRCIHTTNKPTATTFEATKYSIGDPSTGSSWATTGAPTSNPCSLKLYADSISASTTYLSLSISIVVQFRGST